MHTCTWFHKQDLFSLYGNYLVVVAYEFEVTVVAYTPSNKLLIIYIYIYIS